MTSTRRAVFGVYAWLAPLVLTSVTVSCMFPGTTHTLTRGNEGSAAPAREQIDIPAHVLQGYDASSRSLHIIGRRGETADVQIPARFAVRSVPDSAVRSSYFYFVVNDTLWGVSTDSSSSPVDRNRIREIRTVKIDLPRVTGRTQVAGFMIIATTQ
jgi:hypothetical protein